MTHHSKPTHRNKAKIGSKAIIGVIGASECSAEIYEQARQVGEHLARQGAVVVCGGLGGVMEAVSRGAFEAEGEVIAILPTAAKTDANQFATIVIPTGLGEARNVVLVNTAEALIALPGSFGTMSEIALGLRAGKKVFALGDWALSSEIIRVREPAEAARLALAAAREDIDG